MDRAARLLMQLQRLGLLIAWALSLGVPMAAGSEQLSTRIAALVPHLTVVRPEGPGPFPTVLQFHGCGGRKAFQDTWADVGRAAGWAVVVVDSFAPRGIGSLEARATVCTGLRLWGRQRAGDVYAALVWARAQAWADPQRLALAGWSHGAWTIMDALALPPERRAVATGLTGLGPDPLAGVEAAFLVYPYAGRAALPAQLGWQAQPRTVAIVAGRDLVVGNSAPRRHLEALSAQGLPIRIERFANATHAFDEPGNRDPRMRYDSDATRRAEALYAQVLGGTQ